jgi:LPS O-antigen subunit length determinant protein (WzzB/FepE family)
MEEELYDEEVKGEDSLEEQLSTEKAKPTKLNKNGKPRNRNYHKTL